MLNYKKLAHFIYLRSRTSPMGFSLISVILIEEKVELEKAINTICQLQKINYQLFFLNDFLNNEKLLKKNVLQSISLGKIVCLLGNIDNFQKLYDSISGFKEEILSLQMSKTATADKKYQQGRLIIFLEVNDNQINNYEQIHNLADYLISL